MCSYCMQQNKDANDTPYTFTLKLLCIIIQNLDAVHTTHVAHTGYMAVLMWSKISLDVYHAIATIAIITERYPLFSAVLLCCKTAHK